jgi:hypothetical protein
MYFYSHACGSTVLNSQDMETTLILTNEWRKCAMYTQWNTTDEPQGHYAGWNKPV